MAFFLKLPRLDEMEIQSFSFNLKQNEGIIYATKEVQIYKKADDKSAGLLHAMINKEKFNEAVIIADNTLGTKTRLKMKQAFLTNWTKNEEFENFALQFTMMIVEEK